MRDITLFELEQVRQGIGEADDTLQMDQDSFRSIYERTARPLWVYLSRKTGDAQLADDLLQETYYRFLRTRMVFESDSHRKNYLFKIATNLVNDNFRSPKTEQLPENYDAATARVPQPGTDVNRAMARLKPRDRDALWLAYAEGLS